MSLCWHCTNCEISWSPYQARDGCPVCGQGLVAKQENPSPNAVPEFLEARKVAEDRADAEALASRWLEYAHAWDAEVLAAEAQEFLRTVA